MTAANMLGDVESDYAAVRSGALARYRLRPLVRTRISISKPDADVTRDRDRASAKTTELESHIGWSRRESWLARTPASAPADAGPPLDGEWAITATRSVRLIYSGMLWRFIQIDEDTGGREVLRETIKAIGGTHAVPPAGPGRGRPTRLVYAVYWAGSEADPAGLRRIATRFIKFED